jgi:hypothetical protein
VLVSGGLGCILFLVGIAGNGSSAYPGLILIVLSLALLSWRHGMRPGTDAKVLGWSVMLFAVAAFLFFGWIESPADNLKTAPPTNPSPSPQAQNVHAAVAAPCDASAPGTCVGNALKSDRPSPVSGVRSSNLPNPYRATGKVAGIQKAVDPATGRIVFTNEAGTTSGGSKPAVHLGESGVSAAQINPSPIISAPQQPASLSSTKPTDSPDAPALGWPERQSLESACSNAKHLEGPAAYDRCLENQLASLANGPKRPNLSSLSWPEQQSIESACSNAKHLEGPAAYNRCLVSQLAALANGPTRPDLSHLSRPEQQSIESACSNAKHLEGPAAYNRCLTGQLASLASAPRRPDVSTLSRAEQQSIESVCSNAKYLEGPAAYNRCLEGQLASLANAPRRPDVSTLSRAEQQSIESVCSNAKYLEGPAAYNRCLIRQLDLLRQSR